MQAVKLNDGSYPDLVNGKIYNVSKVTSTHIILQGSNRHYCPSSFIILLNNTPIPFKQAYAISKLRGNT